MSVYQKGSRGDSTGAIVKRQADVEGFSSGAVIQDPELTGDCLEDRKVVDNIILIIETSTLTGGIEDQGVGANSGSATLPRTSIFNERYSIARYLVFMTYITPQRPNSLDGLSAPRILHNFSTQSTPLPGSDLRSLASEFNSLSSTAKTRLPNLND
ncbi:hypothetical protein SISNIDRAFT_465250 [Sistotremastrum niveocremeum HHB9708]|uniref:Uncharacterized protein n=1 Tax=Sistotremastrum niveocremeum HHB9708 TaxID=1314777 RepID=A0A164VN18_9AGAM|nr:hypothetical protein SISNIDRAFT_465250 [Sistotremastrum niveocremeum HHB9708]